MSDKDTYPLTFDELRSDRIYEDSRGNWSKVVRGVDQEYELVAFPDGVKGDEVLPSHLPYDKRSVRYRELDIREFASVQPPHIGT